MNEFFLDLQNLFAFVVGPESSMKRNDFDAASVNSTATIARYQHKPGVNFINILLYWQLLHQ